MQLLRVASTMSYQGSPYSGPGDEYDFEDDGYDDLYEYRDPEDTLPQLPVDDSDEDTEEASETDIPNNDEPLEIKEQMYQDKLINLKKQLQQLEDNIHPEFMRRAKRLQHQLRERLCINRIYKDHMYEVVEREYIAEKKAAAKEFDEKKVELKENLLHDFEEKRKLIESERNSMELNGDSIEVKPPMKRILRRRANEPAPAPEKRRKPLATTLTFQLDDRDIDADLRAIARTSPHGPAPTRKHLNSNSYSTRRQGGQNDDVPAGTGAEARGRGRGDEGGARSGRGEEVGARAGRGDEAGARAGRGEEAASRAGRGEEAGARAGRGEEIGARAGRGEEIGARAGRGEEVGARSGRGEEVGARAGRGEEVGARAGRGEEAGAPPAGSPPGREAGECDPRVEDGKLVYERRWYHRGQSVYVEGRDLPRFPAHIHAITDDAIWVKKPNLERVRIYVSQLARGKVTLKRRAS